MIGVYKFAGDVELRSRFFQYAELYTTTIILSGFRVSPGQKTALYLDRYLEEAQQIMSKQTLTRYEKAQLDRIKLFDRYLSLLIRKVDRVRLIYEKLYHYPPVIIYNGIIQQFALLS